MSRKSRFKNDLRRLVKDDIHKPFSRTRYSKRRLSERTIKLRWDFYWRMVDVLYDAGYKLEKVRNMGKKHLEALFSYWDRKGLKAHSVQNYLPLLRYLMEKIDKPALLDVIEHYSARKVQEDRERIDAILSSNEETPEKVDLTDGRSWAAHGVDVDRVINRIERDNAVVALQMRLMRAFGLRVREAFRLKPMNDWKEDKLYIRDGAKGGLKRWVPVETDAQRALLKRACEVVGAKNLSMIPARYSEPQWRSFYYSVLRRNGVTRAVLGITSHGLRHEYAEESRDEEMASIGACGPDPTKMHSEATLVADRKARKAVAKRLGHSRWNVTRYYLDPVGQRSGIHRRLSRTDREGLEQGEGWV